MSSALDRNDPTIRSTLSSFFSEFDNDSGGTLSVIEFVTALRVIGDRLGSEFIHPGPMKLFAELDVDNSGDITLNEFSVTNSSAATAVAWVH